MAFKIDLDIEGDNGVGFFLGYYIDSLDSIYLTSLQLPEIYSVNKEGKINKKFYYGKSKDGNVLNACNSLSFSYHPILKFNNNLFVLSECNRWKYPNPVSAMIDLNTGNVQELPFEYPRFSGADNNSNQMSYYYPFPSNTYNLFFHKTKEKLSLIILLANNIFSFYKYLR